MREGRRYEHRLELCNCFAAKAKRWPVRKRCRGKNGHGSGTKPVIKRYDRQVSRFRFVGREGGREGWQMATMDSR